MKLVRERLFELYTKFYKSDDKLSSIGVGRLPMIIEWCDQKKKNHHFSSEYNKKINESFIRDDNDKLSKLGIGLVKIIQDWMEQKNFMPNEYDIDVNNIIHIHRKLNFGFIKNTFTNKPNFINIEFDDESSRFIYDLIIDDFNDFKNITSKIDFAKFVDYNISIMYYIYTNKLKKYFNVLLKNESFVELEYNKKSYYFSMLSKMSESFSKGNDDKLRRLGIGYLRFSKEQLEKALADKMNNLWTPPKTNSVIALDFKIHGRVTAFTLNVSDDDGQTFNDKNDNPVNYRLEGEKLYSADEEYGLEMKYKGIVQTFTALIYALTHPEKWEEI